MKQKVTSLYISPWSLDDPLCQSQSIAYIKYLVADNYRFTLLTLESNKFAMSAEDIFKTKISLEKENIYWYPVRWRSGNSVFDKLSSVVKVFFTGFKICIRHSPDIIHSRSSLPTFFAVPLARLFRKKFLYDADSLLSEEYADIGHLSRDSQGFRSLAKSEANARRAAKQIIVLTEALKKDYREKLGVDIPIEVIPCCVDTRKFAFDETARVRKRQELGWENEKIFIYVGKYGSWYLVDEMIDFFKVAVERDKTCRLLIITQDKPETFIRVLQEKDIDESQFFLTSAKSNEVTEWLSAADFGLALIKHLPSKRGSSPIKTSEYLANGLPVITNPGIGDLDTIIKKENAGVIIHSFDRPGYLKALDKIDDLTQIKNLRDICRLTAHNYFDIESIGAVKYRSLYAELLKR